MKRTLLCLLSLLLMAAGCRKPDTVPQEEPSGQSKETTYYAGLFAYSCMKGYYLWEKEVSDQLDNWKTGEDPIAKVRAVRYKDSEGNDIDRWTELMDDYSSFLSSLTGNGRTFGFEFVLYRQENYVIPQVTFVYEGSPAQKASLQRGDIILKVDGARLTMDDYAAVLTEKLYDNPTTLSLELADGSKRQLTATQMYSNPVNVVSTFNVGDKTVGYLHFTNFTQEAAQDLEEAFLYTFTEKRIDELVLDLRYNTGGYVSTAVALASLIAPPEVVEAKSVFNQSVYNSRLSEMMDDSDCFDPEYLDANPGIKHLWVIVTGHSASASESLICGLMPYMDVTLVGSTTYGKFCGGYLLKAEDWYDALAKETQEVDCEKGKEATALWGIYVIASRYADCNGETLSMPSGIPAHYEAVDNPNDGYPLGDPSETMLSVVLSLIENGSLPAAAPTKGASGREELPFSKKSDGVLLY